MLTWASLTLLIYFPAYCIAHTPGVARKCATNPQCDNHRYIFLDESEEIRKRILDISCRALTSTNFASLTKLLYPSAYHT